MLMDTTCQVHTYDWYAPRDEPRHRSCSMRVAGLLLGARPGRTHSASQTCAGSPARPRACDPRPAPAAPPACSTFRGMSIMPGRHFYHNECVGASRLPSFRTWCQVAATLDRPVDVLKVTHTCARPPARVFPGVRAAAHAPCS